MCEVMCCAHHGLALMITARIDSDEHTMLFDAGPDNYVIERNLNRMGLDPGRIEAICLSHGHYDHFGGLPRALELISGANGGRPVPVYLHPGAFAQRGSRLAGGRILPLQSLPLADALEAGRPGGHVGGARGGAGRLLLHKRRGAPPQL